MTTNMQGASAKLEGFRLFWLAAVLLTSTRAASCLSMDVSKVTNAPQDAVENRTAATTTTNQDRQLVVSKPLPSGTHATDLPREQKLAYQISIAPEDSGEGGDVAGDSNPLEGKKAPSGNKLPSQSKRPYDSFNLFEKNYYIIRPLHSSSGKKPNQPKVSPQIIKKLPPNYKSKLIRTQHRPPWLPRGHQTLDSGHLDDSLTRRFKLRITTLAPTTTTTELFRLISSAHSPLSAFTRSSEAKDPGTRLLTARSRTTIRPYDKVEMVRSTTKRSIVGILSTSADPSPAKTAIVSAKIGPGTNDGRIISPVLIVSDGDDQDLERKEVPPPRISYDILNGSDDDGTITDPEKLNSRKQQVNLSLRPNEVQTTIISGKKPVTIIRHVPRTTPAPLISIPPNRIQIEERPPNKIVVHEQNPRTTTGPQLVRLIAKQKHKYDDNIVSPALTVVDNEALRLPQNATSVHNNKLVVAIRPGRPIKRHPPTTQFPVYNIVAGITPPYPTSPSQSPWIRPPPTDGSVYGLLKPNGSEPTTPAPSSSFGAQNLKFPAPAPSVLDPEQVELPSNINISVPDSANFVGPNKVPDRIVVNTNEQGESPPNAVVVSDATHVGRPPYGQSTFSHDGITRLSTTRKPTKLTTTRRINIVSANTTVITTDPDQLHDVLSNVIAGSHQLHHAGQNKPSGRPTILGLISKLFNAGITTTVVAVLTLIKTIIVAILVMFLPPMALTAAIMQAVG